MFFRRFAILIAMWNRTIGSTKAKTGFGSRAKSRESSMSWSSPVAAAPSASSPPAAPARASGARTVRVQVAPDGTLQEQRPDGTTRPLAARVDPARIAATTEADIAAQAAEDDAAAARDAASWVRGVRHRLGLSQAEFARRIAVPVATVRNWEQGKRAPRGPARALLRLIDRAPEAALAALRG